MSQSQRLQQARHITQSVIQYMISNGCVEAKDFRKLCIELGYINEDQTNDEEKIHNLVGSINKKLRRFHMMIRSSMDEITTNKYFVLISTVDNDTTHAAHFHTPKQYEFFKLLLTNIIANPRGIIELNFIDELATLATLPTKGVRGTRGLPEHRALFNDWCAKKWFIIVTEDDADYITLGVRCIAELDVFIKQKLAERAGDLDCKHCNTMSIYSVNCNACDARFHKRCGKMMIDQETGLCKNCSHPQPSTSTGNRSRSRICIE